MGITRAFQHKLCLFCRTGAEYSICQEIRKKFPDIYPLAATQEKHKIVNKINEVDRRIFLPGYLFLYSNGRIDFDSLIKTENIYRILGDEENSYELRNSDRSFADWLLQYNGLIGISRISNQHGKIRIRSGPLKFFSKNIIKFNKHTRNALVRIDFAGMTREIWLAFEFEDEKNTGGKENE